MPITDKSSHLGIVRSTTRTKTENETKEQNITKLEGRHVANSGLDPTTDIAIIRCYILPILTYGLEILQPRSQNMNKLEQFLKALLKRILSLPPNVPDPALYIISGLLPVQAQIDIKCLTLFNNICRQNDDTLEKRLAFRQLNMKENDSTSWFNLIKRILLKYSLQRPLEYLSNPMCKLGWKKLIQVRLRLMSTGKAD